MWTTVGMQRDVGQQIVAAAQLELDCVAAYEAACKIAHPVGSHLIAEMAQQAGQALADWQALLRGLGLGPAQPAWTRRPNWLKAALLRRLGIRPLALALLNNAAARVQALRRLTGPSLPKDVQAVATRHLSRAERHRAKLLQLLREG